MAYVQIPKDMTEVQSRLILNLTKRQVICFSIAGAIGVPVYLAANSAFGSTAAMMFMIATTLPAFFFAIYKKDGIPAEKFILLVLRQKFFYPPIRRKPGLRKGDSHARKQKKAGGTSGAIASQSNKPRRKRNATSERQTKI